MVTMGLYEYLILFHTLYFIEIEATPEKTSAASYEKGEL